MIKLPKIILLHIGLYRFLKEELKKKRTPIELIKFSGHVIISYIKELIKLFLNIFKVFDKEYRKQQAEFKRTKEINTDLQRALKLLHYMDKKLIKMGKKRHERRQFWRDFFKSAQVRTDVYNELGKEIEGEK